MLCTLWWVFQFLFEIRETKIFATTPHVIGEHSPPQGAVVCFIYFEMPPSKEEKTLVSP